MHSHRESYNATVRDAQSLIDTSPSETATIIHDIFATHGITDDIIEQIITSLRASPERHLDFLIDFHHKEARPDCNQAWISAITLAVGYFVGGFIPLIPYFIADAVIVALYWSIAVMGVTLLAFGYVKTGVVRGWTGADNVVAAVKGGVQMCFVGGVAAGAAIGLVRVINGGAA
ncbi:Ccc1 family [Aspergillus taichungensis]|uniref:Ccc1 family n=1 Tax=Aspergillus taichungensis TaxID=482145 RepID=A0A2J5I5U4_9EURO|nr:Ccc1 family [Aspergillus taichungensis]